MGLEQRDQIRWSYSQNNWRQEDDDAYDRQAVQHYQEASVRGLQSGQIQWWSGRSGQGDDRAVRRRLAEQSLQVMEQDELRKLLPTAGACRLHSQEVGRPKDFRCADTMLIMHLE